MLKKIMLAAGFLLFAGVLVVGATNRTAVKNSQTNQIVAHTQTAVQKNAAGQAGAQRIGQANNQKQGAAASDMQEQQQQRRGATAPRDGAMRGADDAGNAQTNPSKGQGQARGEAPQSMQQQGQDSNRMRQSEVETTHTQITLEGTVVQVPTIGVDLIIQTDDEEVTLGTGPNYLSQQGFTLDLDEPIEVTGFWEDEEFKVSTLTRLVDGAMLTLRDESGRPLWSGATNGGRGNGQRNGSNNGGQSGRGGANS